ncbi:MAG: RNA polymerase sigma factor [Oscillospiraceae bacterium]|nr:RNA polymerase sigma factor [Oscillospiraceae bacterium]
MRLVEGGLAEPAEADPFDVGPVRAAPDGGPGPGVLDWGAELFRRYKKGDEASFERLVELYGEELSSFINGFLDDLHESRQLMIESFACLAVNKKAFEGRSSLKTYLFGIGKNLARRYLRMRKDGRHISYEESVGPLLGEGEDPEAWVEREESKAALMAAIEGLNEEYGAVIRLLYLEGHSYVKAGQLMGKSVRQISDLAYRAKRSLRKALEGEGYGVPKK